MRPRGNRAPPVSGDSPWGLRCHPGTRRQRRLLQRRGVYRRRPARCAQLVLLEIGSSVVVAVTCSVDIFRRIRSKFRCSGYCDFLSWVSWESNTFTRGNRPPLTSTLASASDSSPEWGEADTKMIGIEEFVFRRAMMICLRLAGTTESPMMTARKLPFVSSEGASSGSLGDATA